MCDSSSLKPSMVAVRVVTAPVYGESYSSWSCWRSDDQAQDELIRGGEMSMELILTMMCCWAGRRPMPDHCSDGLRR